MNDNPLVSNVKRIKRLLTWVGRATSEMSKNSKNFCFATFYDYKYFEIFMKSSEGKNNQINNYLINIKCEDNRELNIEIDFYKIDNILNINMCYRIDDNSKLIISKKLYNIYGITYLINLEFVRLKHAFVSDTTEESTKYPLIRHYKTVYLDDDQNEEYKHKIKILEEVKFTDDELNYITDLFRDTVKKLNGEDVIDDETKRKLFDAEEYANTLTPDQEYALRRVLNRRYMQNRNK